MSTYEEFSKRFSASSLYKEYIVYDTEVKDFCKSMGFLDLERFFCDLQTRSYPSEVLAWAKFSLYYMYECDIPIVNASLKTIPSFLFKNKAS